MNIQIFGTKKCADTRKAERFFSERKIRVQKIDLAEKGMSAGELRAVIAHLGGAELLIDRAGKRYLDKGLKYAAPTGPRIEQMLLEDPLLMKTPVVRNGRAATLGFASEVWQGWIDMSKT